MQENKASRLFLVCSVVLGILAAVVSFAYLGKATGAESGPPIQIVVAARDLRENTLLDPDKDFQVIDVPASMTKLKARGVHPEDQGSYKGQRVNRLILSGTPVMLADVAMPVADLAPAGDKRALSIPAKGAASLSGLLVPGDYVKLLVTYTTVPPNSSTKLEVGKDPSSVFETKLILPDALKVLAVGSHLYRSRQQISVADQFQRPTEGDSQQTVTLEVTEDQAITILRLTGAGQFPVWVELCPQPAAPAK